jgi:hypothetical protein
MIRKILFAAMFSGAAFAAQAQSAGFSITGVIPPSACTISLGGGGAIDFGTTPLSKLLDENFKPMSMAVTCPAPTRFALAFTDNRNGTVAETPETSPPGLDSAIYFGLGTYNGRNIGNARFYTGHLQIRTAVGGLLQTPAAWLATTGVAGSNSSWAETASKYFLKDRSIAFAASANATAPDALTEVSGIVHVAKDVSGSVAKAATSDIQLDGSGTVTLVLL